MLYYELKKIFLRPVNKIALLFLITVLCIVSYFAVAEVDYVDRNGDKSIGIAAARTLKEEKNQWAGYITEEVLLRVLEENTRINHSAEYLSDEVKEQEKAYSRKQGFANLREMINCAYCSFREYNYFRADSVTNEEIGSFYERRTANLTEWLNSEEGDNYYSEKEKQFLTAEYEKLKTPYYYEYADGWESLLLYLPSIIMLFVLIAGFLVSGIFSDEIQLKADSVFFSTKLGRDKAVAAKVGAGLILITAVYWMMILLYSGIVLAILGFGGADCAIQNGFSNWKSFYNITWLQDYLLTVFGGYLGSLFILTLSMLVSAKMKSKAFAVTIPFILLFIPSFLGGISALSDFLGLLPDQLLQMCNAVRMFYLYQIGEKVTGSVPVVLVLYEVLFVLLLPVLYRVYRRTEVK